METKRIALFWYYHLPSVSTDEEVRDRIETSIKPLLLLHKKYSQPFSLAITGSFLKRIRTVNDDTLSLIRELVGTGIIELSATFYHEVFPLIIPISYLEKQIIYDIQTKQHMFGIHPVTFYPVNFCCLPFFPQLLNSFGIKSIVLDELQYHKYCMIQTWKWNFTKLGNLESILIKPYINTEEVWHIFRYRWDSKYMNLFFRSNKLVQDLSFGTSGLLHKPYNESELEMYIKQLEEKSIDNKVMTLADDGDRINPVSLYNYGKLLQSKKIKFITPKLMNEKNITFRTIEHFPGYTLGNVYEFWLNDLDSISYLSLLNQIYNSKKNLKKYEEEILELQELFYIFWKNAARKKYYLNKLYALYRKLNCKISVSNIS